MDRYVSDEMSVGKIYGLMREFEGQSFELDSGGNVLWTFNEDFDRVALLYLIERFVDYVKGHGDPLTDFNRGGRGNESKGVLFDVYDRLSTLLAMHRDELNYGRQVNLFFQVVHDIGWPLIVSKSPVVYVNDEYTMGDFFNKLISALHKKVNGREFKEGVRKANAGLELGFRKAKVYVSKLFQCHARLLIVRIDLRYRTMLAQHERDLFQRFQTDLRTFKQGMRRSRRHKVFDGLVGYIQALEYGMVIGHHSHFIFFFDGSKRKNDRFIADEIGRHWLKVTLNDGGWFSSNLHRKTRSRRDYVLGMVHRSDLDARSILNNRVVGYLFKRSQLLRFRFSSKTKRIFMAKPPKCARG